MASSVVGTPLPVDKENASAKKKRARKSVGARVSFGNISIHHYEKVETSPCHPDPVRRKFERRSSVGTAQEAVQPPTPSAQPQTLSAQPPTPIPPPPPQPPPPTPPPPPPAQTLPMASPEAPQEAARLAVPPSPAASEMSEIQDFFSPASSVMGSYAGSPAPLGTPSLSSLLVADASEDASVPKLAQLLAQDARESATVIGIFDEEEDEAMMDMTVAVGGILGTRLPAESGAPRTSISGTEQGDDEDETMDMTMAVGGIISHSHAESSQRVDQPPPDMSERGESDDEMEMTGVHGEVPPRTSGGECTDVPAEADEAPPTNESRSQLRMSGSRRFSFSEKLAAVSHRIFGRTSEAEVEPAELEEEEGGEAGGPGTPGWLSALSPAAGEPELVSETPGWLREADAMRPSRKSRSVFDVLPDSPGDESSPAAPPPPAVPPPPAAPTHPPAAPPPPAPPPAAAVPAPDPSPVLEKAKAFPQEDPPAEADVLDITTFDEYLASAGTVLPACRIVPPLTHPALKLSSPRSLSTPSLHARDRCLRSRWQVYTFWTQVQSAAGTLLLVDTRLSVCWALWMAMAPLLISWWQHAS